MGMGEIVRELRQAGKKMNGMETPGFDWNK
jgi:hypothetical protein